MQTVLDAMFMHIMPSLNSSFYLPLSSNAVDHVDGQTVVMQGIQFRREISSKMSKKNIKKQKNNLF